MDPARNVNKSSILLSNHFNSPCTLEHFRAQPIEKGIDNSKEISSKKFRQNRETYWMKELRTVYPFGLNDQCVEINWTNKNSENVTMRIFNRLLIKRSKRGALRRNNWSSLFSIAED